MKFLCIVCIFYIMCWQTTFSYYTTCYLCDDVKRCSEPSYSRRCSDYIFDDDICVTVVESRWKVVFERKCVNKDDNVTGTEERYRIGECIKAGHKYYCSCAGENCNGKLVSEMDFLVEKPPLMCYQCHVTESPDCFSTSEELLVPCAEEKNVTAIPFNASSPIEGDYYCTTEFVNDKTVSRDCKKKKDLPNPDSPDKCFIDGSTRVCACQTGMCNHWSSFSAPNDASVIKGFYIGILTCSIIYSLVK